MTQTKAAEARGFTSRIETIKDVFSDVVRGCRGGFRGGGGQRGRSGGYCETIGAVMTI